MDPERQTGSYPNPYLAGIGLGLVLLASFLILGAGLGSSATIARLGAWLEGIIAPAHVAASQYFGRWSGNPLHYYLTYMFLGAVLGGLVSAVASGRFKPGLERGAGYPATQRMMWVVIGGLVSGFATRLARGCTSGQALTGGALLSTGSVIFLICAFIGGFAVAALVRRQWND